MNSKLLWGVALLSLSAPALAAPCAPGDPTLRLPDLAVLEPQRVRVIQRRGFRELQFSTRVANLGSGPLHIRSQATATSASATQIVHRTDGTTCERALGSFPMQSGDRFFRLPNYVQYLLRADDPLTGRVYARGTLRGFCIADIVPPATEATREVNSSCGDPANLEEGISVGWADFYDGLYPDQNIPLDTDAGSVPPGKYYLVAIPDPANLVAETDDFSTSHYGVLMVDVPGRIGATPIPIRDTPQPTATSRPPATPTATARTTVAPTSTATRRGSPTPTPRATLRPRPSLPPRPPRPTRIPRPGTQATPTPSRAATPTPTRVPPTATATSGTPAPTATPTRTSVPTASQTPRPTSSLDLCSPSAPAAMLDTRMWRMYYAYPGNTRALTVTASINLGRGGAPLDPIRQPVALALLDHRKNLMLEMRDLRFVETGNGSFAASTPQGLVTLQQITGGYNFNFQFTDPTDELIIPEDLWSGSQTLCFAVGNRRVYEPFVCQIKPNNGFLCHDNN